MIETRDSNTHEKHGRQKKMYADLRSVRYLCVLESVRATFISFSLVRSIER